MKLYKKIITGLILALICGILPAVGVAKVKALTLSDIQSASDLKNTSWILNEVLVLPEFTNIDDYISLSITDPNVTNSTVLATYTFNNTTYNIHQLSGRVIDIQKISGTQTALRFYLKGTIWVSANAIYTTVTSGSSEYSTEVGSLPRRLSFNDFEFSQTGDFVGWLKSNATLENAEEEIYKINFNLNGGTSEQPADIEFNTSITINKNDLPIPTRENYKFLHWAWADTDNIEYAEPFTQESITFTDTNIYMWAIWTIYDANMVFHLNNILILDARLVFAELEQPEEIAGEIIDKIAKIELIGDNVTTFKMIISTLSLNPMLESSSPYISYILNYTNHVEIGFNFNSEYLNSISATSLYNVAEWTNIEQDTSFNDYLEIYINKPGQVIEVELESAKLVNDDIDNINTGANAVFNIITNFLNINIGFLTVGSIIAVLLAVAVLGFIIKIWQGGNNG